jgi:chromosome segregation ATPase
MSHRTRARTPPEPAALRQTIAAHGRKEARRRVITTVEKLAKAMRDIEHDVEVNNGVYPFGNGKLSRQEVFRRAALGPAVLEKKRTPEERERNAAMKRKLEEWLGHASARMLRGAKTIRRAITARVDEANEELKAIRQRWVEAELEYLDCQEKLAAANSTIGDLRKQAARLEAELGGNKVVPMRRDGGRR